jgi:hypothetical protein
MFTVALILLVLADVYFVFTTLVDVFPFNNVREAKRSEQVTEVSVNGPIRRSPGRLRDRGELGRTAHANLREDHHRAPPPGGPAAPQPRAHDPSHAHPRRRDLHVRRRRRSVTPCSRGLDVTQDGQAERHNQAVMVIYPDTMTACDINRSREGS